MTQAPSFSMPDEGDWKWGGWFWCSREMHYLPSWRNRVLQAHAIQGSGYWRLQGRHGAHASADSFQDAWRELVDREPQFERRRARRASKERTPGWRARLGEWVPEKRCSGSLAEDANGSIVHHDDPKAVRWCLAGWLAHSVKHDLTPMRHGDRKPPWWEESDDESARGLLDHVWESIPTLHREFVERIRRDRVPAKDRKRLDQHPLGYWWLICRPLAEVRLGLR